MVDSLIILFGAIMLFLHKETISEMLKEHSVHVAGLKALTGH